MHKHTLGFGKATDLFYSTTDCPNENVGRVVGELGVLARLLNLGIELVIVFDGKYGAVERLGIVAYKHGMWVRL
jgi:hypothetical protein